MALLHVSRCEGVRVRVEGGNEGAGRIDEHRERERERLQLMVLHLPGSMSITALITLSKESISLFSL